MSPVAASALKLDENFPDAVLLRFEQSGFDVKTARAQGLAGRSDEVLWQVCAEEGRVLVTLDKGFTDLRARPRSGDAGVIVLRPRHQTVQAVSDATALVIDRLQRSPRSAIANELWIANQHAIRVRRRAAG